MKYEAVLNPDGKIEIRVQAFLVSGRVEIGDVSMVSKETEQPVRVLKGYQVEQIRQLLRGIDRWLEGFDNPNAGQILSIKRIAN